MDCPEKIRIIRRNKLGKRWYDDKIGEVFTVTGFNSETQCYQVDTRELYDKAEVNYSHATVPVDDAEAV